MIEELAVLGGPSNLHDPSRDDGRLVVPDTLVHLECAPHALEGGRITPRLQDETLVRAERRKTTHGRD